MPSKAWIGVRISWLIFARYSDCELRGLARAGLRRLKSHSPAGHRRRAACIKRAGGPARLGDLADVTPAAHCCWRRPGATALPMLKYPQVAWQRKAASAGWAI